MVHIRNSGRVSTNFLVLITIKGVGEIRQIPGRFNSQMYVDLLKNDFLHFIRQQFPEDEYSLLRVVQDNSRIHTARIVMEWFEDHPELELFPHPPYSPDLNPIENILGIMKKKFKSGDVRNLQSLVDKVHEVWDELILEPHIAANCINSMPTRFRKVIAANGYWMNY